MESYHNAVSDKLVVVLFENLTIYQVFKKDNLLKWKTVIHGQAIPKQLKDAIFTSSTLISCNQDFTLAPLQLEDYSNFYSLNFQDSSPIKCFNTEEFAIVSKESSSVKKVAEHLVGVQENIDINLVFAYAADKVKKDAVYFYKQADRITVLAWKDGKFALANRYPADNLDEVFYYIMLVVEQLELQPADIYFEAICTKGQHESYHALFKKLSDSLAPKFRYIDLYIFCIRRRRRSYLSSPFFCSMRIVSGIHKGFRFPKKNMPHARPTTDRAKESLFNILDQKYYFEDIQVLDLYSGLGSMAFEFCSRGTTEITAVEWNAKSIGYIKEIISKLGVKMVLKQNKVLKYLKKSEDSYDIIFADPPYNAAQEIKELIDLLASGQYLKPGGVFILEHQTMAAIQHPAIIEKREYGQSTFSFFKFEDKQ